MAQTHALSGQVVSVRPLGEHLKGAKTTAILKAEELEIVRVVLLHALRAITDASALVTMRVGRMN